MHIQVSHVVGSGVPLGSVDGPNGKRETSVERELTHFISSIGSDGDLTLVTRVNVN